MAARFGLGADDRFSMLSGLAHDPLQRDIFTPLCLGATLHVPEPEAIGAPGRLAAWMARERVTVTHLTPAMGQVITEPGPDPDLRIESLRCAFFVGEALTRRDVARLRLLAPHVRCVNLFGPTETQRAVGFHLVEEETGGAREREVLPIGRGMAGVRSWCSAGPGGWPESARSARSTCGPHLAAATWGTRS